MVKQWTLTEDINLYQARHRLSKDNRKTLRSLVPVEVYVQDPHVAKSNEGLALKEITASALLAHWMPLSAGIVISIAYRLLQTVNEVVWALLAYQIAKPEEKKGALKGVEGANSHN